MSENMCTGVKTCARQQTDIVVSHVGIKPVSLIKKAKYLSSQKTVEISTAMDDNLKCPWKIKTFIHNPLQ